MVFKENKKSLEIIPNINKKIIEFINAPESLKRAEKELKFMEKNNVNHLFYTDKNYPSNLKLCMDSPVNLFYKGSINWDSSKVAKHLLQMEFKNLIISLPGKIYKRRM